MNPMKTLPTTCLGLAASLLLPCIAAAQQPATINGIQGVKQEAVPSIKNIEPPATQPVTPGAVEGVKKVEGVNTINGVKAAAPQTVQPIPPPPAAAPVQPNEVKGLPPPPAAASAVQTDDVKGVKPPPPPNAVQAVPPPPAANAVSTIRAVQGVQGIVVPKQRNLEAALLIKEGTGIPDPKGKAAAAALFGPPGKEPGLKPGEDGRNELQEFEKLNTPGS
ncbi:hypothetical protein BGE01nite_11810 [Brevifollis gellanilyticus]|uniref:Uncharacterized protein n=2 Tax=Brevifollis gellanilyticus TaxID=748831 RepID=A0A512M587_9BACT|nr:hypothetical protein BGE01nite_11810 [Brevifollis gellanilyticus]